MGQSYLCGSYVGGIIGSSNGNITQCSNKGKVIGVDKFVGGIVGCATGVVESCYNTGKIDGKKGFCGGIIGINYPSLEIKNCYNIGEITGEIECIGGIIGKSHDSTGVSLSIANCYNIGKIKLITSSSGAIIGNDQLNLKEITNNYWNELSECQYGRGYNKSNTGATKVSNLQNYAETLGDSYTSDVKNEDATWKYNNGYPILKWQLEQ